MNRKAESYCLRRDTRGTKEETIGGTRRQRERETAYHCLKLREALGVR